MIQQRQYSMFVRLLTSLLVSGGLAAIAPAWSTTLNLTIDGQRREVRCNEDVQTNRAAQLQLTREQCFTIGRDVDILPENVAPGTRQSATQEMLTVTRLGQPAPPTVQLNDLPARTLEAHPELARYRYFVKTDDVALVDRRSNIIVALVEIHVRPDRHGK